LHATITPPEIDRRPRRTSDNESGHGRRPPNGRDLKRTGGGGDNDNWDDSPTPRRRPGQRLAAYRLNLLFSLAAVFMFFVGIVSVFVLSHNSSHIDAYNHIVNTWFPTTIPPILWLNTAILLLSSVTVEIARRHMFHPMDAMDEWLGLGKPTSRRAFPWLVATLVLGSLFLTGQMLAWHQLSVLGAPFTSSSSSAHSFYIITWAHAAHLTVGVGAILAALIGLFTFKSIENRQIMVDCTAWYWHAMGALWLILFALLAFCQ